MSCPCGKCHCYICGNPMTKVEPDPRDELIRVYEEALKDHDCSYEPWNGYKCPQCETLAQGAEIKKRMEEG